MTFYIKNKINFSFKSLNNFVIQENLPWETPNFFWFAIGNGLYVQETPNSAKIYNALKYRLQWNVQMKLITRVMVLRC